MTMPEHTTHIDVSEPVLTAVNSKPFTIQRNGKTYQLDTSKVLGFFKGFVTGLISGNVNPESEANQVSAEVIKGLSYVFSIIPDIFGWQPELMNAPKQVNVTEPLRQNSLFYNRINRLSAGELTDMLRRFRGTPEQVDKWYDELRYQGWSEEQITGVKLLLWSVPNIGELVALKGRQAYDTDTETEYNTREQYTSQFQDDAQSAGITADWADSYWRGHWKLPGLGEVLKAWQWNVIGDDNLKEYMDASSMVPAWIERLKTISWEPPSYFEIADVLLSGTVPVDTVIDWLVKGGRRADWAATEAAGIYIKGQLSTWKTAVADGLMSLDDVRKVLEGAHVPETQISIVLDEVQKPKTQAQTQKLKSLTESQILDGVKKGIVSQDSAIQQLMQAGYNQSDAEYLYKITTIETKQTTRSLTESQIVDAWKNDTITTSDALSHLETIGYTADEANLLLQTHAATITVDQAFAKYYETLTKIKEAQKSGLTGDALVPLEDEAQYWLEKYQEIGQAMFGTQ